MKTVPSRRQGHAAIVLPPAPHTTAHAPTGSPDLASWAVATLLLLLGMIWFGTLGTRSLIHPDEGR